MESSDVEGKHDVCIVTGGGGALGIEVCRALASTGNRVIAVDLGDSATAAAQTLERDAIAVTPETCDVSDAAAAKALLERVLDLYGTVNVLVNLAGVVRNDKLIDVSDADFDLTITSHARGTLNMMRTFAPHMKKEKYGRIINTSSVAALGSIGGISYTAAKGAIEAMTRTAAVELARHGITVNCVAPGVITGGMFTQQPERARNHMLERTPMRRGGAPSEIAACYRFLGSRDASFVTGQTLYVCGGASLGGFN